MIDSSLLERVRSRIGWQSEPSTEVVEAGQVRRFCEAIGDPDPRRLEEVPPTFLVTLSTDLPEIPEVLNTRLQSFEITYRGLDYPGRKCTCRGVVQSQPGNEVIVEIWTEDPQGSKTTVGTATLEVEGWRVG